MSYMPVDSTKPRLNQVGSSREAPKFVIRWNEELRQVIETRAAENGRSMNAEIVNRLVASCDLPSPVVGKTWTPVIGMAVVNPNKHIGTITGIYLDDEELVIAVDGIDWPPHKLKPVELLY